MGKKKKDIKFNININSACVLAKTGEILHRNVFANDVCVGACVHIFLQVVCVCV